jgi:hypothetical protein
VWGTKKECTGSVRVRDEEGMHGVKKRKFVKMYEGQAVWEGAG